MSRHTRVPSSLTGTLNLDTRLSGDIDDVLGVVEKGDGVVIAAEQQDPAIHTGETFQRRSVTEGIVPGLLRDQVTGPLAPDDESGHVRVDH